MKKTWICVISLVFFFVFGPAHAIEVSVEMTGAEDFVRLKDGIQKTVVARCLAGNVHPASGAKLCVSLIQLGDTISFDAVLDSQPPFAFHRDMSSRGEISGVIDRMIEEIAARSAQAPPAETRAAPPAPARESLVEIPAPPDESSEIELPFVAASVAVLGDTVFVSDQKTLYRMERGEAVPCWSPPGNAKIYRLYPYQDSLLVVTGRQGLFHTYRIRGLKAVQSWERCVIPLGDALVTSRLMTDPSIQDGANYWEEPVTVSGGAFGFPQDVDFVSAFSADIHPAQSGPETIAFDKLGRLSVHNGKERLWKSETRVSTLPLYLERASYFENRADRPRDDRYYLMPRMVAHQGRIITIANDQGAWRFLGNVKFYESSRIVSFSPDRSELRERDLATVRNHYCADIAVDQDELIVLVIKKSTSVLKRIGL